MGVREVLEAIGVLLLVGLASALVIRRRRSHRIPAVAAEVVERVAHATSASEFSRILVPTLGGLMSDRAVVLACKLAHPDDAQVEVLYVVEVPMAMPPTAELPEAMARAGEALAEAELIGRASGVRVRSRVEKGRFAGKVIVDVARNSAADVIVLGSPASRRHGEWGRTIEYVFRNAPCDVIVERAAT